MKSSLSREGGRSRFQTEVSRSHQWNFWMTMTSLMSSRWERSLPHALELLVGPWRGYHVASDAFGGNDLHDCRLVIQRLVADVVGIAALDHAGSDCQVRRVELVDHTCGPPFKSFDVVLWHRVILGLGVDGKCHSAASGFFSVILMPACQQATPNSTPQFSEQKRGGVPSPLHP